MMQCREIDELMVDFLYQELDATQADAFHSHVDGCPRCGAELRSMQRTRQALRALPELEPSPAVSARLLHEASRRKPRAEEQGGGILGWFQRFIAPIMAHPGLAAAASIALVVGIAGFLRMRGKVDERAPTVAAADTRSAPAAAGEPEKTAAAVPPEPEGAAPAEPAAAPVTGELAREEAERGRDVVAAKKPDLRSFDAPDAPKGYTSKVPAPPVVAAAPKAAPAPSKYKAATKSAKEELAKDQKDLDSSADRQGRMSSTNEAQALKNGVRAPAGDDLIGGTSSGLAAGGGEKQRESAAAHAEPPRPAPNASPAAPPPPPAPEQATQDEIAQKAIYADKSAAKPMEQKKAAPAPARKPAPSLESPAALAPPATTTPAPGARADSANSRGAGPQGQAQAPASPPADAAAPPAAQQQEKLPPDEAKLREAQKSASSGNCEQALTIGRSLAKSNPEFYRRRVAGDPILRQCEAEAAKRRNKASPQRAAEPKQSLDEEAKPSNTELSK
jgi:putative zinc finger protein